MLRLLSDLANLKGASPEAESMASCVSTPTNLCLNGRRFKVEVDWRDFDDNTGSGTAVPLTSDTGYFWFFRHTNVELVVKVLDGRPINACMMLAVLANGREITTIRGLAGPNELHPLQESFIEHGAVQCGYCSPGMILSAKALLDQNPHPSEAEVRRAISGNICRCTGYQHIVEAVQLAAEKMRA